MLPFTHNTTRARSPAASATMVEGSFLQVRIEGMICLRTFRRPVAYRATKWLSLDLSVVLAGDRSRESPQT